MDSPSLKSAQEARKEQARAIRALEERIATHEHLISAWTRRRDEGDATPDVPTLVRWIEDEEAELVRDRERPRVAGMERPAVG